MMNKKIFFVLNTAILIASSESAYATSDVYRFVGYGPISSAMGGSAMAHDVGVAGMMANPATLSLMREGAKFHLGADVIMADISVKNLDTGERADSNNHANNRGPYIAPQLAYAYHAHPYTFGVGLFAYGGVGTEYGDHSFLSRATGGVETGLDNASRLLTLNIPFAASYEVNDRLSVGASIDAVWQGLNVDLLMGADQVAALIGSGRATGSLIPVLGSLPDFRGAHLSFSKNQPVASGVDAWGLNGRIGMLYKITDNTMFGLSYAMESKIADMKGNASLTAVDAIAGQISLQGRVKVRDFQSPAQLSIGFSHQVNDQWLIAADLSRVFWEHAMKDIDIGFVDNSGANLDILIPQNYKDQTALSLGTAYEVGKWTLRAGARFATQALRSDTLLALVPATPNTFGTAGFSYQLSQHDQLDFSWTHSFKKEMTNSSLPNTSASVRVSQMQDSMSIAYTYQI